jgi:2-desacetyl-2-hydroxyethyl bacteriochlorophyllide A dehydrogenase
MKAIVLEQPGRLTLMDVADPDQPDPGKALVRIRRAGVCGTDLHAFHGEQPFFSYPRILGHELGVEVVATGDGVTAIAPGMRCALEPYFNCGRCAACRRGRPNCCTRLEVFGVHIDGGLREYAVVPASKLHPSASLSFAQLALVEPLAIGAHAVARAQLKPAERVLVIGAGPIGLAVTTFAVLAGADVLVTDINVARLQFAQQRWPEIGVVLGGDGMAERLADVTGDDLPVVIFDATGNRQSMQADFQLIGHGGRLVFVGLFTGEVTFDDPNFHRREVTLLSSRNALAEDFKRILHAMEAGSIDIGPLVTHHATLQTMIEEFPRWFSPDSGLIKAQIAL